MDLLFSNYTTMAHSLNEARLIGNMTANAEIREISSGKKVANFSLATSYVYKDQQGEKHEKTEFHNIVVWGALAEIIEKYTSKGSKLFVCGRIETRTWEDQAGVKKYKTEIVADNVILLGQKKTDEFDEKPSKKHEPLDIDSIPF